MAFSDPPPTSKNRGGAGLLLDEVLAGLKPKDRAGAEAWLRSPHASLQAVADKFTAEGFPVSSNAVRNWRKKYAPETFG